MLNERVKKYFDIYPELRILFHFDHNQTYSNEIENWSDKEIILIQASDKLFQLKFRLETELAQKKVFIYFTYNEPQGKLRKTFLLLDLMKANKILLIDEVENFMQEYNLKPYHREKVNKYINLLKDKKVQKTLASILKSQTFDDKNEFLIKKGLICHQLGFTRIEEETIIIAKLFTLFLQKNKELFSIIDSLKSIDGESYLCTLFDEYFDMEIAELTEKSILFAVKKAKYNLILQNLNDPNPNDDYSKLKINNPVKITRINSWIVDWLEKDNLAPEIEAVFSELASDVDETVILKNYGIDGDYGFYTDPLSFKIIKKLIEILEYQPDKSLSILSQLNKSSFGNKSEYRYLLDLITHNANVFKLLNSIVSFVYDKPINYIKEYVNIFSKIDYHYRKAVLSHSLLKIVSLPNEIRVDLLIQSLNKKYDEYLRVLNSEWLRCLQDHEFEFCKMPILKQYEFFSKKIAGSDQKIAVIISDGMRYEIAKELLSVLLADPKHQADISYVLSSLPSNTRMGMSSLLPHSELQLKDQFFYINHISTEGLENREKILRYAEEDSRAITFNKLQNLSQEEARNLFKSKIVYIYHDVIDATGDEKKTELKTFNEVENALNELVPMIKKIHSSYNVAKVIITADHGFLFNASEIPESMYEALPDSKNAVWNHNRFSILKQEIKTDSYMFDLSKASNIKTDFKITIPKAINRYKRQGHGVHYVHGGASLQEMIIPLIESSRKREEITEKVSLKLLNKDLKLVSGAIKIKLIQDKAVSNYYKPLTALCGIYKETGELVSNEIEITFASTSELATERVREVILNLSLKAGMDSFYVFKIYDKQKDTNRLNPILTEKVINQTLIQSDFE